MITAAEAMALFRSTDIVNIGLSMECAVQKLARVSVYDGKSKLWVEPEFQERWKWHHANERAIWKAPYYFQNNA